MWKFRVAKGAQALGSRRGPSFGKPRRTRTTAKDKEFKSYMIRIGLAFRAMNHFIHGMRWSEDLAGPSVFFGPELRIGKFFAKFLSTNRFNISLYAYLPVQ
eukprot:GHVU01052655.1.p2 GENE.GHVU01052655.1~~GHVU01052655.1.p2  ORF type:complete len:101 (+),score=3.77 GHVU01052655.1:450-752(+)